MSEETRDVGGQESGAATGQPQQTPSGAPAGTMEQDAVMVFLSYFGIFALIPFLTVKDNDYIRWHSKQGLTFFVATTAAFIALTMVTVIIGFVPVIGQIVGLLLGLVMLVGAVGLFVLWIMALVKAFGGERWRIPVIADLADKW
ncbi:MAG: DUF4870 domain-containing protein [Myxococcota bacterium]